MKMYVQSKECRPRVLMDNFDHEYNPHEILHACCDVCAEKCKCQRDDCSIWSSHTNDDETHDNDDTSSEIQRAVSKEQMKQLHSLLIKLKHKIVVIVVKVCTQAVVSCPNKLLEFNNFNIRQALEKCRIPFSFSDIIREVKIWRYSYAKEMMKIADSISMTLILMN